MCGIIGYIGPKAVVPVLIDGLRRLEYRGYDSAGIAVVRNGVDQPAPERREAVAASRKSIRADPIDGEYGIGHTRWATHGRPTEENAHPHRDCTGRIVVVHNGIIENYLELKHELQGQGHKFVTETDTEIVAHLVEQELKAGGAGGGGLEGATRRALARMRGHVRARAALRRTNRRRSSRSATARRSSIGIGDGEYFVASDIPAILAHTRDVVFLADEEMAVLTADGVAFTNFAGTHARPAHRSGCSGTRSRPRRPGSSTSCSRRSSSSRRRCATRCSAACRSTPGGSSSRR